MILASNEMVLNMSEQEICIFQTSATQQQLTAEDHSRLKPDWTKPRSTCKEICPHSIQVVAKVIFNAVNSRYDVFGRILHCLIFESKTYPRIKPGSGSMKFYFEVVT